MSHASLVLIYEVIFGRISAQQNISFTRPASVTNKRKPTKKQCDFQSVNRPESFLIKIVSLAMTIVLPFGQLLMKCINQKRNMVSIPLLFVDLAKIANVNKKT